MLIDSKYFLLEKRAKVAKSLLELGQGDLFSRGQCLIQCMGGSEPGVQLRVECGPCRFKLRGWIVAILSFCENATGHGPVQQCHRLCRLGNSWVNPPCFLRLAHDLGKRHAGDFARRLRLNRHRSNRQAGPCLAADFHRRRNVFDQKLRRRLGQQQVRADTCQCSAGFASTTQMFGQASHHRGCVVSPMRVTAQIKPGDAVAIGCGDRLRVHLQCDSGQ
ncbi:hypothetical protein PFLmoz3_00780 [Pseudomonas fluorescens]|uniref:Uncharacterized protein n=1 Tax=Pseudomonas fluorescens TaxID=294 RepID=A0A125QJ47_PSEFL|nr:hypothetical protein PFLmoz3_00780 [Pseudomonas fluorescens]